MKREKKKKKQRKKWTRIFFCSFVIYREKSVSGSADANSKVFHRESPPVELWRSSPTRFNSLDTNSFPSPSSNLPPLLASTSSIFRSLFSFHSSLPSSSFLSSRWTKRLLISMYTFFRDCKCIDGAILQPRMRTHFCIGKVDDREMSLLGWNFYLEAVEKLHLWGGVWRLVIFRILYESPFRRFHFRRDTRTKL